MQLLYVKSEQHPKEPTSEEAKFRYVVLLDDFTASGLSYIREDEESGEWAGKIPKIVGELSSNKGLGQCVANDNVRVLVIIYIGSKQAIEQIEESLQRLSFEKGKVELRVVFEMGNTSRLDPGSDATLFELIKKEEYFDQRADDEHAEVGKSTMRLGFADGRLPLVLSHNTPNNSIYLIWAEDGHKVLGLFPRVSRHKRFD